MYRGQCFDTKILSYGPENDYDYVEWLEIKVVGMSHEKRHEVIWDRLSVGDYLFLQREPDNPVDPYAIKVLMANGQHIGYVPATVARNLAVHLDGGLIYDCRVHTYYQEGDYTMPNMSMMCILSEWRNHATGENVPSAAQGM